VVKLVAVLIVLFLFVPDVRRAAVSADLAPNVRGIHTLVGQSAAEQARQLGWARHLVSEGGYVAQPFSPVDRSTAGPSDQAVAFVERAYALGLNPIITLQGAFANQTGCDPSPRGGWERPVPDEPNEGNRYHAEAGGYRDFVAGLARTEGRTLYVEVGNEPNLNYMWGGQADPTEYARFLVDVSAAIQSLGDDRIKILNAGLAPEGDVDNLAYIRAAAAAEPGFLTAFDAWASHPYPHNQPPERNLHDGTARPGSRYAIDAYLLELAALREGGRDTAGLPVVLTETGYELGDRWYPEYPPIDEENRAEYTRRAFDEFWVRWPEVWAVTPFELSDPNGSWKAFDWVWPTSATDASGLPTQPHLNYARLLPGAGAIRGAVTDGAGNPLAGVTLTGAGHTATTVQDGSYTLIAEPGASEVLAQKTGYLPAAAPLGVTAGEVVRLDLALRESLPTTVQNPSFESEDLTPWTSWGTVDGVQESPWYDLSARHRSRFLGTAANCGEKDGGVYQAVAAVSGRPVRLAAWLLTTRDGEAPMGSRLGLDPHGGTNPESADIVWSDWIETNGKWRKVAIEALAAADRITIFLQYDQNAANRWSISAFDEVALTQGD
jgi:Carboxypeptidase regulatory-like domain